MLPRTSCVKIRRKSTSDSWSIHPSHFSNPSASEAGRKCASSITSDRICRFIGASVGALFTARCRKPGDRRTRVGTRYGGARSVEGDESQSGYFAEQRNPFRHSTRGLNVAATPELRAATDAASRRTIKTVEYKRASALADPAKSSYWINDLVILTSEDLGHANPLRRRTSLDA